MVANNQSGQSVLEFLIIFPAMIGLVIFLVKVNTAVQVSVVNQQYSRSQLLFLAYNSPDFPELRFRSEEVSQLIMGVSDNIAQEGYTPEATVVGITRPGQEVGDDRDGSEPRLRGRVRIRNSVAMCSQNNFPAVEDNPGIFCRSPFDE